VREIPADSIEPGNRAAWRAWLQRHHARQQGVWLVLRKKRCREGSLELAHAVEEALCFGWIDSKLRKIDDQRFIIWIAPRKKGSIWARSNRERVERLIASGRMTPAGMERVNEAKADGSWNALIDVEELVVPHDLSEALEQYPCATENFRAFPRSAQQNILYWISSAKRGDTRARRIAETARLASDNLRPGHQRLKE